MNNELNACYVDRTDMNMKSLRMGLVRIGECRQNKIIRTNFEDRIGLANRIVIC